MPITRRQFLQAAAAASAAAACSKPAQRDSSARPQHALQVRRPAAHSCRRQEPLARPLRRAANGRSPLLSHRHAPDRGQAASRSARHPMWTFGGTWPGPTIETRSGEGLLVEWANELPEKHFLPIDHRLHGAEPESPKSGPWSTSMARRRRRKATAGRRIGTFPENRRLIIIPTPGPGHAVVSRPRHGHQPAEHLRRIGRRLYRARRQVEDALNLPKGRFEIPLILCDRFLLRDGSLDYPDSGEPGAPWVPEVFGNVMTVNGKVTPYLDVEPRKYRFRVLNASNGRFYHLSLSSGQEFHQIGTDQGLLPAPIADSGLRAGAGRARGSGDRLQGSPGRTNRAEQRRVSDDAVSRRPREGRGSELASRRAAPGSEDAGIRGRADSADDDQRVHGSRRENRC